MTLLGEGTKANPKKALELYEETCEAGRLPACRGLGVLFSDDSFGVAADLDRARPLLQAACERGDPTGCHSLGRLEPENSSERVRVYKLACDESYLRACWGLGQMYQKGIDGGRQELVLARAYFHTACKMGQGNACEDLAELYKRRPEWAGTGEWSVQGLYKRACKLGSRTACFK